MTTDSVTRRSITGGRHPRPRSTIQSLPCSAGGKTVLLEAEAIRNIDRSGFPADLRSSLSA